MHGEIFTQLFGPEFQHANISTQVPLGTTNSTDTDCWHSYAKSCRSRCCDCCMRKPCVIASSVTGILLIVAVIVVSVVLTTTLSPRNGDSSSSSVSNNSGSIPEIVIRTRNLSVSMSLTRSNQTFSRYQGSGSNYYYNAFRIEVTTNGTYTFMTSGTIDTYGYMYSNSFSPTLPMVNVLAYDDSSAGNNQFLLALLLNSSTNYYLVITTYLENVTGLYTFLASGSQTWGLGFVN